MFDLFENTREDYFSPSDYENILFRVYPHLRWALLCSLVCKVRSKLYRYIPFLRNGETMFYCQAWYTSSNYVDLLSCLKLPHSPHRIQIPHIVHPRPFFHPRCALNINNHRFLSLC
jgi:hypothetical protein